MFTQLQCTNSFYFNANAFVTEIASNGAALVYSTYFGGTNYDIGKGIAVDSQWIRLCDRFHRLDEFSHHQCVVQQLVWTTLREPTRYPSPIP